MPRNGELDDRLRTRTAEPIPHMDGGEDDMDWRATPKKKKTPKETPKKGSGEEPSAPRTPSGRGRGRGRGGANVTATAIRSTRGSTTVGTINYTISTIGKLVTNVEDTYNGPPAAAFTSLRFGGSVRFKATLQRLEHPSQQIDWSRHPILEPPQHPGPAQDLSAAGVPEKSPVDSGIDVLTPPPDLQSSIIVNQQSTPQVEDMAPVREISQAEVDRMREHEAVSGKRWIPLLPLSLLSSPGYTTGLLSRC